MSRTKKGAKGPGYEDGTCHYCGADPIVVHWVGEAPPAATLPEGGTADGERHTEIIGEQSGGTDG